MISIKHFLNRSEDESVVWRVVYLLLEKIATEAVQGDRSEYESFIEKIEQIRESVANVASPETLMVTIGSAVQAMTEHKQRVSKFIRWQRSEMQTIFSMLTDTVVTISGKNNQFARSFQEIGESMERAVALDDLRDLKLRLSDCLHDFRDQVRQQKTEMEGVITALEDQVERSRASAGPLLDNDPATGLPQQGAAEAAMSSNLKTGARNYVVTVVVSRMQSINARFGYQLGDQVLRTCKEHIEKQLQPRDRMFRWAGPAMVLVLERADSLEVVRGQLKRILDARIEETFTLGSREVLIPISVAWSAFKLISPVAIAVRQIQTFIASQSPRDFA